MNAIEKNWQIKDRTYILNGMTPLTYKAKSKNILWFDESTGKNRELCYAVNQNSLFVDEQDEHANPGVVMFNDGVLYVSRQNQQLQKLLSIYHPDAGTRWHELDSVQEAEDEIDVIEYELQALNMVQNMAIDELEAIMRTELGSSVTTMSSKELKRDGYAFARKNPKLFIELTQDEDIKLRNLANRAVESGILALTEDGTVFKHKVNGRKVMTVPFDVNPYAALAQYFKTDDGINLMKSILKKLD